MKLLFSEFAPDYSRYLYPYVVWGIPESHETPADLYAAGFHPASPQLDRFSLCRHLRVQLAAFMPSSENRRILRKGESITCELVPRSEYRYDDAARESWLAFAEDRFGAGVMPLERLDGLMASRVISHVLRFLDLAEGGREVGTALLYLEPLRMAHYYYAFYDRTHANRSLGLYMMTCALQHFQAAGFAHVYLGTCYSERALYKTQFSGVEFFNGVCWSDRVDDLKFLVRRDANARHLLQEPEFLDGQGGVAGLLERSAFVVSPVPSSNISLSGLGRAPS